MRRGYRGLPHSLYEQASKRVGDSEEGKMDGGLGEVGGGGGRREATFRTNRRFFEEFEIGNATRKK